MRSPTSENDHSFGFDCDEETTEEKTGLNRLRLELVAKTLKKSGARTVADLGCGEGKLLRILMPEKQFARIVALDISPDALAKARAKVDLASEDRRKCVELIHGSLLFEHESLHGLDAACLVEVIEHLETDRLERVSHNLFHCIRPKTLVITTPNQEYNAVWGKLPAGKFRHHDHHFEWTRAEFEQWAHRVKQDYEVGFFGVGEVHREFGQPTQMAVFIRQ